MNILNDLNWRYAVKKFSDKTIPERDIQTLKNAIRLTPSSYGLQPYRVMVIQSDQVKHDLLPYSYSQEKIAHCSHLFVFAAETASVDNMVERYINTHANANSMATSMLSDMADQMKAALSAMDDEQRLQWAHQQAFIALGNFLTCAASLKVDTCPMGGFETEGYDKVLGLKKLSLTTSVICPAGYRHPDDHNAYRPKVRLDISALFKDR